MRRRVVRMWTAAVIAGGVFVGSQSSWAAKPDESTSPVIVATGGRSCQISNAVLHRGVVYLQLSELARCMGGSAQLTQGSGTISAKLAGETITIWPWGEPVAVRNGLEILSVDSDAWFWFQGGFFINPAQVEAWTGQGMAVRADPARIPVRFPSAMTYRTDMADPKAAGGLKILVDPGHGGEDLGAVDPTGIPEKRIVLAVSQKLAALLEERGYQVRLTRTDDSYPTLSERVQMANRWDADLMISIHANSAPRETAQGVETYVLSRHASDPRALALAKFENAYDAGQSRSDKILDQVLADVARQAQENASNRFAPTFHETIVEAMGAENRGVRKAPFFVLAGTTMPAFLLEIGFLSNADEARQLRDDVYQARLAKALVDGVDAIAKFLKIRSAGGQGR